MQVSDVSPFLAPLIGAIAAFALNRGTRVRRARTAALDDLEVHERATALLESGDPLVDQLKALAKTSVTQYYARRIARTKSKETWVARIAILTFAFGVAWLTVRTGLDNFWTLAVLGLVGGTVGILCEDFVERRSVRRAFSGIKVIGADRPEGNGPAESQ